MNNREYLTRQLIKISKKLNILDVEFYLSSANLLKTTGEHYLSENDYVTKYNHLMNKMSDILRKLDYDEFSEAFGVKINLN